MLEASEISKTIEPEYYSSAEGFHCYHKSLRRTLITLFLCLFNHSTVQAENFATQIVNSTFKLYHKDSTGTCFLVKGDAQGDTPGSLYLVTAAHVLERTKGKTAIVVLRKRNADASYKRHDHTITIREEGEPNWLKHESKDLAILRLSKPLPVPTNALPYSAIADEAGVVAANLQLCSSIFLLTYPERVEANKAGFPVARQSIISSYPLLPIKNHATYFADFTTFSGDSGGPVFIADKAGNPLVVGIVLAKSHHEERVKTQYEEHLIRHSLGLGTVLHAQFVRDLIDKSTGKGKEAP